MKKHSETHVRIQRESL